MKSQTYSPARAVPVLDLHPAPDDFHGEFIAGLNGSPKRVPCKYFYDAAGSELFEQICQLPEYYPTRTELGILRERGPEIADLAGENTCLVEPGSGSTRKVRVLLDHLRKPAAYVPVEISRSALLAAAAELRESHPWLEILPVCADYTGFLRLPPDRLDRGGRTLVFFPGSTIGNFEPDAAQAFLARIARMAGSSGLLLIGVDLRKAPSVIEAAYNDAQHVTSRFNKNILLRANRELGARFDVSSFRHRAIYDRDLGRIEMRLISHRRQIVPVNGSRIHFSAGEAITTEFSYKYSIDGFRELAAAAGYRPLRVWTDAEKLFSVHLMDFGTPA